MELRVLRLRKTRHTCGKKQEDTKDGNEGMGLTKVVCLKTLKIPKMHVSLDVDKGKDMS